MEALPAGMLVALDDYGRLYVWRETYRDAFACDIAIVDFG